jgi:hypothetical protein
MFDRINVVLKYTLSNNKNEIKQAEEEIEKVKFLYHL